MWPGAARGARRRIWRAGGGREGVFFGKGGWEDREGCRGAGGGGVGHKPETPPMYALPQLGAAGDSRGGKGGSPEGETTPSGCNGQLAQR